VWGSHAIATGRVCSWMTDVEEKKRTVSGGLTEGGVAYCQHWVECTSCWEID